MITRRFFAKIVPLLAIWLSALASAETTQDKAWQISVGVGLGVRTNPVMDNKNIPLVILPHVSYQGDRFFIDNLDWGIKLVESEHFQLNALLTPSYDQIFFHRWDANNFILSSSTWASFTHSDQQTNSPAQNKPVTIDKSRLHPRRMAAFGGFEWRQSLAPDWDLNGQCLTELTGYYGGSECRLAITKTLNINRHELAFTFGESWQSSSTLTYFYGVNGSEGTNLTRYAPSSGHAELMRVDWAYPLTQDWDLRLFASYKWLPEAIAQSPLVTDDKIVTVFVGGVYHF